MEPAYSKQQDKYVGDESACTTVSDSSQTNQLQSWPNIVAVVDTLLYPSHNTPHPSRGKSQTRRYIRHKWVIDKALAQLRASAPFAESKHQTCASLGYLIFGRHIASLLPADVFSQRFWTSRAWDAAKGEMGQDCVCVALCEHVFHDVFELMCNKIIKTQEIMCWTGI